MEANISPEMKTGFVLEAIEEALDEGNTDRAKIQLEHLREALGNERLERLLEHQHANH